MSACLGAFCLAALLLVGHPAIAGETSAKGDRLVVSPVKGDLLDMKPASAVPASLSTATTATTAKPRPVVPFRGTAARKLIDVAVRDDGVWLNSFATRAMPLDGPACADLSEDIVSRLPVSAVERLADEDLMHQTRVCGVNGSLLVTCYGGSATVSLRPSQHGDGCR
ncbi:MAG TPA: hypothetical protein VMO81_14340 [Aestuariivirgaceae bacterium]|nr:hypothetical protein [Aestuariivirgaceae bacterium]